MRDVEPHLVAYPKAPIQRDERLSGEPLHQGGATQTAAAAGTVQLGAASAADKRRRLSVLFCHLVGSMEIVAARPDRPVRIDRRLSSNRGGCHHTLRPVMSRSLGKV